MKNLYTKLFNLQSKIGAITKDATNPFFKSKYFDINGLLAELKPLLTDERLVILQSLISLDGNPALETTVIDTDSGEEKVSTCSLPESTDPQKMGSIITYFRRYTLTSLLLLQAEDDDGNKGVVRASQTSTAAYRPSKSSDPTHQDIDETGSFFDHDSHGQTAVDNTPLPFKSGDRILGQLCPDCNKAEIVKNPHTKKLFCQDKCWLKK